MRAIPARRPPSGLPATKPAPPIGEPSSAVIAFGCSGVVWATVSLTGFDEL
jgi:hypothetical protein